MWIKNPLKPKKNASYISENGSSKAITWSDIPGLNWFKLVYNQQGYIIGSTKRQWEVKSLGTDGTGANIMYFRVSKCDQSYRDPVKLLKRIKKEEIHGTIER